MFRVNKSQERLAAFVFGIAFVAVLVVLAIVFPNPTAFQYTTFRIVLALAAAGVAVMIPGFLNFKVGTWLRAGGALGVFAIVYFKSPAALTAVNVGENAAPRQISVTLARAAGSEDCPVLPQSARLKVVPLQAGNTYPDLDVGGRCAATLAVPATATGLVKLSLVAASPFELVKPDATYQLETTRWVAAVSDTPRMHLLVSLFSYAGQCGNLQSTFETFHTILLSKARSLRNLFAAADHRYDYLNGVNVIAAGQSLNMSTQEIRTYWRDNGALQILSGMCVGKTDGETMRSSIFLGPLSGSLADPLIADLKIADLEFGTTRDVYTAAMLYALAREAQSRKLDQDIVISFLGRAREVALQIPVDAGKNLVAAIDVSLQEAGAPTGLPQ